MTPTRIAVVRMRTLLVCVGILVILGIAAAAYFPLGSVKTTRIVVYEPTGFHVTEEREGYCWTGSLAAQRAGAFRCASGNSIYDPCFATDSAVACPVGDPAKNEGVLLRLAEPLPEPPDAWQNPPDISHPQPWYVNLAEGGFCGALTGTRPPDFPLGCQIPSLGEPAFCSVPVPLASSPAVYGTLCGLPEADGMEIGPQRIYLVRKMWL